eukprot:30263-Eustigmatos_ZCMA.PRE.1
MLVQSGGADATTAPSKNATPPLNPLQKPEEHRTPDERMEVATKSLAPGDDEKRWNREPENK